PDNGSASYSANAVYANDTWQYSIMSYFAESNYSGSSYRYVVTPQMADIYAVGSIYGAATSTRPGDTVYGFNSNAGAVFSFGNYIQAPALTIYDSGGNDTLVFLLGESSATSGQHERITEFVTGTDSIDLSGYDAISGTAGYDMFKFIATASFDGSAGELDYFYNSSLGVTTLQGDTNGDS